MYEVCLLLYLPEYASGSGGQVEFEPTFIVASKMVVVDGIVDEFVIVEAVSAKVGIVCIQDVLVSALLYHKAVVAIRVVRTEVEEEQEVATTESKHLVAVVVPYLDHILLLETLIFLEHFEHC